MRVGVWRGRGVTDYANQVVRRIAAGLRDAGHTVTPLSHPAEEEEIALAQAILLGVGSAELPEAVAQVSPHLRPHHIVLHVLPGETLAALAPARSTGAVVGSLVPLWSGRWAVEYTDELGQAILELLAGELGGVAVPVSQEKRAALATALSWHRFSQDTLEEADRAMRAAFAGTIVSTEMNLEERNNRTTAVLADAPDLARQFSGIVDPGRARIFAQLARRAAERDGREEVELWAMQEETP